MKANPYITEYGRLQGATRYEIADDAGNAATFTPAAMLEIMDILLLNANAIIKQRDAAAPGVQTRQPEQIDQDIDKLQGEILKMQRKLITLNSKANSLIAQAAASATSEKEKLYPCAYCEGQHPARLMSQCPARIK